MAGGDGTERMPATPRSTARSAAASSSPTSQGSQASRASQPVPAPAARGPVGEARPAPVGQSARPARRPLRRRSTVRKIDPWSVLKLSLLFYFCALLVLMLALTVFWAIVNQLGLVDRLLEFLADLQLVVEVRGGMIARAVFLIGLLNVVLWSGINVFLAFLYNLIADLVGGLRITLYDDE